MPLHVDAPSREFLVILVHAVVDVNQVADHITIGAIRVVGRQPIGARRGCIARDRRLTQARREALRSEEFQCEAPGRRIKNIKRLDVGLPPPALEQIAHELGVGLVVRRTDMVRLGRELLQPGSDLCSIDLAVEAALEGCLRNSVFTVEAVHRGTVTLGGL